MTHRFLTLNIRHGGGKRVEEILGHIQGWNPDTIVLTEYRGNRQSETIQCRLAEQGWKHQASTHLGPRINGILVASRIPVSEQDSSCAEGWSMTRHLNLSTSGFDLIAVYLPPGKTKLAAWDRLLGIARDMCGRPTLLLGDFNTGKHHLDEDGATFIGHEYPGRLEEIGFTDTWRCRNPESREPSWVSHRGNGFRLDYAYASPVLTKSLEAARFDHSSRTKGMTDHSTLIVDFQPVVTNLGTP